MYTYIGAYVNAAASGPICNHNYNMLHQAVGLEMTSQFTSVRLTLHQRCLWDISEKPSSGR